MKLSRLAGFVFFLTAALSFPIHAAEVTANISGTLKDSTGAVIPGVAVTLTNTETNVAKTVQSGLGGAYSFTLVPSAAIKLPLSGRASASTCTAASC